MLKIRINDVAVPDDYISRVYDKDGQNLYESDTLPPFHLFVIDTNWATTNREQPLVFGYNTLTVQLIPAAETATAPLFRFLDMVLGVQADGQGGVSTVDLSGSVDDFAVWSRTLSDAELNRLYETGLSAVGIAARTTGDSAAAGSIVRALRV